MARSSAVPSAELQQKLVQDEEWLSGFQDALTRSGALTSSVSSILDDFRDRISSLSNNVSTLYAKTSTVQREQQNVKKLLSIVDATIQFHGKTLDFENTIRDGNLLHNLEEYLEKMNNLKEAISFFSSHTTYQSQFNHMKQIFETGCSNLEAEFGNLVKSKTVSLDPTKILECLDEEYEMPTFRMPDLATIKDTQKLNTMASWMLSNSDSCSQYLDYFSNCRSDNMLKTLKAISDQSADKSGHFRIPKPHLIKAAWKRAAGKANEKGMDDDKDNAISSVLFMLAAMLILIQLEADACAAVFANVKVEASVFRQVILLPLSTGCSFTIKIVDAFEGDFESILPLTKFFMKHENQIGSLCQNIGASETFALLKSTITRQSLKLITNFLELLTNDHSRFVPEDGNVHHITSKTINLLKLLAQNRPVINYLYEAEGSPAQPSRIERNIHRAVTSLSSKTRLSKLFAQMLSALGTNLKNKSATYSDNALGALFMFNNLSYIRMCCAKDKNLMSILNTNTNEGQLLSFYDSEIEEYLSRYLASWTKVTAIFSGYSDDRKAAKYVYSSFNKEFESVIEAQKNYCLVDMSLANDIRKRIKDLVLKPYMEFNSRDSKESAELELDRQLKYDAESVELIIDRLFDVTY